MSRAWDLLVKRDELSVTELVERDVPEAGPGEVLLRVDRVGMTANNVTYALAGDLLSYWRFFPADDGWGRVPLWGFADVVASESPEVSVGTRVYGYLPTSSHLVVKPTGVAEHGFKDGSEHRTGLDSAYNIYAATAGDPSYVAEHEDLQILYRPLFITSFMLDDFLADNDFFGAERIVVSSASSKTAYATAFCISRRDARPRLVALTSPGNVAFTRTLPYEDVVTYDDIGSLATGAATLYLDLAGNNELRRRLHAHFGDSLVYDCLVGVTHQEGFGSNEGLPGPEPVFFFAPTQISKRRKDWGPGGIEQRYGEAWRTFVPVVGDWVDVQRAEGAEGLRESWLAMLAGKTDPKTGLVISLIAFNKTQTVVRLYEFDVSFVSRSEAKRLTRNLDQFAEVVVDFEGVEEIGQGFADEIFRVWQREHPDTQLFPVNMKESVELLVAQARQNVP